MRHHLHLALAAFIIVLGVTFIMAAVTTINGPQVSRASVTNSPTG